METRDFQQALRTATVTYPIPFMVGILLLFALLCFSASITTDGLHRWVLTATAIFVVVAALGLLIYTVCFRPDLLRSESHVLMMTLTNVMGDKTLHREQRARASDVLIDVLGQPRPKGSNVNELPPPGRRKEHDDG